MSELPILDDNKVIEFRDLDAQLEEDIFSSLFMTLEKDLKDGIVIIQDAWDDDDVSVIREQLHSMKGSCMASGGIRLAKCCEEILQVLEEVDTLKNFDFTPLHGIVKDESRKLLESWKLLITK